MQRRAYVYGCIALAIAIGLVVAWPRLPSTDPFVVAPPAAVQAEDANVSAPSPRAPTDAVANDEYPQWAIDADRADEEARRNAPIGPRHSGGKNHPSHRFQDLPYGKGFKFNSTDPKKSEAATRVVKKLAAWMSNVKYIRIRVKRYSDGRLGSEDVYTFSRDGWDKLVRKGYGLKAETITGDGRNPSLVPPAFHWLVDPTYWSGADMIWRTRLDGQPVTLLEFIDVGSTFYFLRIYVSDKTGMPVAAQTNYGGDEDPMWYETYEILEADPPVSALR